MFAEIVQKATADFECECNNLLMGKCFQNENWMKVADYYFIKRLNPIKLNLKTSNNNRSFHNAATCISLKYSVKHEKHQVSVVIWQNQKHD